MWKAGGLSVDKSDRAGDSALAFASRFPQVPMEPLQFFIQLSLIVKLLEGSVSWSL